VKNTSVSNGAVPVHASLRRAVAAGALLAATLVALPAALAADLDGDGVDVGDNCPSNFNPLQADCNADGVGDACNNVGAAGADADRDGRCDAVDNCATTPNIDQGDCNGNNVGDMCEGSTANRDTDRDGVCNAVDVCPLESGGCAMQAITVPWVPANPTIPHVTYSGATHTLKGIARYGANQYMWSYGDGAAPMAWTAISDAYNLGVNHVYTGAVGQTFIATLSVRNAATPNTVATALYRVKIADSGPLPAAAPYAMDPNKMDPRIDMAIDQGLWYLHTTMSRSTYADGVPGYAQNFGTWAGAVAGNCTAVDAFLLHGSKPNKDYATDPYVETAQRSLNYILASMTAAPGIGAQTAGNPDYNLNGVGIRFGADDTYVNGICGVAIASAGTPTRQSLVGANTNIRGRTYKDLTQDMAEFFAWGQTDSGTFRGGWLYSSNSNGADGSTNQWPLLAIAAAEDNNAITTPRFVRTEAPFFMTYSRHAALDNDNGGWGYNSNSSYVNPVKTAAGMLYNYFEGNSTSHPEVKAALGWLYRNWNMNDNSWNVGLGNSYAMYGIMKAMRKPQPNILRITEFNYNTNQQTSNSFDWYYTPPGQVQEGLATNLVRRQAANGSWVDQYGENSRNGTVNSGGAFATGWDVLILSKGVTTIPPVAAICDCTLTWDNNQDITLDGSCTNHPDLNRSIVKYEWDFNYNVTTFDIDAVGAQGIKFGGYNVYGSHPVALRVTDDNPIALGGPQSSIATCTIVTKPPNNCPHPDAGGPYLGFHGVPVQLDARNSSDPDGDAVTYSWDFNNDGIFGDTAPPVAGPATTATPSITFNDPGTYTIAVKISDVRPNNDGTVPCERIAYSTVEIGNHAPIANPGGPYKAPPGQQVMLIGTGSSDPDGDTISFAWDLNNDGAFGDSTQINPIFTVPANAPANTVYSVCLKVTDAPGRVSDPVCTTVKALFVNSPPTCTAPAPAIVGECNGGAVRLVVDGINASDVDNDPLTYAWSTTCPAGTFANPAAAMTTLTLDSAGGGCSPAPCLATLTISDGTATAACQRQINIIDSTPPTFTARPVDTTIQCDANANAAVAAWLGSATATDSCTQASLANDFIAVAGGCGGATGTRTVTWTATDTCGNPTQTSAVLSVVDTTAPTMSCPAPTTQECTAPQTRVNLTATATDGCLGDLPTTGPTNAMYPVGVTQVAFASTDSCGNTGGCNSTVTITDTTAPTLSCPENLPAVECNGGGAASNIFPGTATATDLCSTATVTSDAPANARYPLGLTTTTHTAVDAYGNSTTCESTVTVRDTLEPAVDCPADVTVECNAPEKANGVNAGQATATDVCSPTTVTDPAVGTYALGTSAATHSATDESGNAASCTNLVTVVDTTDPTLSCPAALTVECNAPSAATDVAAGQATATDICSAVTVTDPAVATYPIGTTATTHSAIDAQGNETSCQGSITVVDTTNPTLSCPAALTVECNAPNEATNVVASPATATDICSSVTVTNPAAASYPIGTTATTHTAVDAFGNTTTCAGAVIVADTTSPTLSCPADQTVECNAPGTATGVNAGQASATDVCSTVTVADPAVATYALGANPATHTATDAYGNTTSCDNVITVVDSTDPTLTCPAALTVECNAPSSATDVAAGHATATDVCGAVTITDPDVTTYQLGTTPTSHSAIDAQGNDTTCAGSVTVVDTTAPTLSCPAVLTVECNAPSSATDVVAGHATATDVCSTVSITDPAAATYAIGTTATTHTAIDAEGNQTSCAGAVIVTDTTDPTLSCPADLTVECNAPGTATGVNAGQASATDICSAVTVSDPAVAAYALGANPATHTAIDAYGNETSCANVVTVVDTTDPTLTCPATLTVECNAPGAATNVIAGQATATDVCSAVTVTDPAEATYPIGTTAATHTAIDAQGNDLTCAQDVIVQDTTDPTLLCPADVVVECNAPSSATGVSAGQATATDVCSAVTVTDPAVGTYALGDNTATHAAVDAYGNDISCTNTVTVRDTTAPVFDEASLGERNVSGDCSSNPVAFALPTATDAADCQAVTVTCGTVAGNSVGANTVTCTATDASGNATSTTITVNILSPYRLAFSSLADDNVMNDPETDADKTNLFKTGSKISHTLRVYNCLGVDVTPTVGPTMTLRLTVTRRSGVAGVPDVAIVPDYSGVGDAGGVMVLTGGQFKYTLDTNSTDYPSGTIDTAAYFTTLVTATYNNNPGVVVAREDARLETNNKGK
jgi:hypothetical protein